MANTQTRSPAGNKPQAAVNSGQIAVLAAPRLAPPAPDILKRYEVDTEGWRTLTESIFPAAKSQTSVMMALEYCARRKLDIFKHPVHIVPIWNAQAGPNGNGAMVETIWPGINELRTTAIRTGQYAGMDMPLFGPRIAHHFEGTIKTKGQGGDQWKKVELNVEFPEWCQITVYRTLGGNRVPFPGPRVFWLETYARLRNNCDVPNSMWEKRANGQIEKCAEAAALRRAFPEELGSDYSIDEIGAFTTHAPTDVTAEGAATVTEPRREDFVKPKDEAPPAEPGTITAPTTAPPTQSVGDGQPEAKAGEGTAPSGQSEKNVTDVHDENAPIEFEVFKTARAFFEFSDGWLQDPKRTPAEAVQWEKFYHDKLAEMAKHEDRRVCEATAEVIGFYSAVLAKEQPK